MDRKQIMKILKRENYIEHYEPYYRGDLNPRDTEIESYFGICNTYFLLEDEKILEVVSNYNWRDFVLLEKYCGICKYFGRSTTMIKADIWNEISKRVINYFTKTVENNITIEYCFKSLKSVPKGKGFVYEPRNTFIIRTNNNESNAVILHNSTTYKNKEKAYFDVIKLYFEDVVMPINLDNVVNGDVRTRLAKNVLDYCFEHIIDISDLIQYTNIRTCIDKSDVLIFVSKNMLDKQHPDLNVLFNDVVELYQKYSESKKLTVNVYDRFGELLATETGFIGEYIDEAGIEKKFGIAKEKLGLYKNVHECITLCTCKINTKRKREVESYNEYIAVIHKQAETGPNKIPKPDTNLEFWIGEKIPQDELNSLTKCPWFRYGPGIDYIGTNYTLVNEDGCLHMPNKYVSYNVQNSSVNSIEIRDPDVQIYGVNMKSSQEEIANAMTKNGFVAVERYHSFNDTIDIHWVLGSIHISFYQHIICISIYHIGDENILY